MRKSMLRATVAAATFLAPLAFTVGFNPAVSSADCTDGEWWNPAINQCQASVVPNCENGWWDPVANTCRAAISTTPLGCDNGWWWDPVANVCREPLFP